MHPKYRPDIDGLRAIAVSSFVAYNYELPIIKGGFVGVDVFFVISAIALLCWGGSCPVWAAAGVPLQFDADGHLTRKGSLLLARRARAGGWEP